MNEIKINTSTGNSLLSVPFFIASMLSNPNFEIPSISQNKLEYEQRVDAVFQNLPMQNIIFEDNQMNVLVSFLSKIINESKDLDSEIVDMVNKNFWDLI